MLGEVQGRDVGPGREKATTWRGVRKKLEMIDRMQNLMRRQTRCALIAIVVDVSKAVPVHSNRMFVQVSHLRDADVFKCVRKPVGTETPDADVRHDDDEQEDCDVFQGGCAHRADLIM